MTYRKVFLCYSRDDLELLEAFRLHLAPWEKSGQLDVWVDDPKIEPGQGWDAEIQAAIGDAHGAVLLVSPSLLAVDYVRDTEIPLLMEAAQADRLVLTPLFLRPAADPVFDVVDAGTGEAGIRITQYQGLNQPDEPLAALSPVARDAVLKKSAEKLWATLEARPEHRDRRQKAGRPLLQIELRPRRDEVARFLSDGTHEVHRSLGRRDPDLAAASDLARLSDEALGERLWRVLLGDDWEVPLRRLLKKEPRSPLRHPLRVRIRTEDPALRALPWALTSWRGYCLTDQEWTFELAAPGEPRPLERLRTPCSVLMIGAEVQDRPRLDVEAHHLSFRGLLHNLWEKERRPEPVPLARTLEEALDLLHDPVPRLLYVYGHAEEHEGELALLLPHRKSGKGSPAPLPVSRLAEAWGENPPRIVFLHTVGSCPLAPHLPGVSVLLHQRYDAPSRSHRGWAQRFWREVLGHAWEPVQALHALGRPAWRATSVETHYEDWESRVSDQTPKVHQPRARLDRTTQRDRVRGAVQDLVHHRRVLSLIAYGASGNLVREFSNQMAATLRDWDKDLVRVHHIHLRLGPERGDWQLGQVEETFRYQLSLQPGQTLEHAFHNPRRGGPRATPLFLLDWQTYGDGHEPPLRGQHLLTWLEFCRRHLDRACPRNARILSYLGVETDESRFRDLVDWAEVVRHDLRAPHFDFLLLPPLAEVTPNDLAHFLQDEANSSCPEEFHRELPERIYHETRGNFEETVKLLEVAERDFLWPELARALPKAQARQRRKDIEL